MPATAQGHTVHRLPCGVQHQGRGRRRFIGRRDTGEARQLATPGTGVVPLGIALLAHRQRGAAPDLVIVRPQAPGEQLAQLDQRRDQGQDHHLPLLHQQGRQLAGAANVFLAIDRAKAQVAVQAATQRITDCP